MKNSKQFSTKGMLVTMLVIGNIIVLRTAFVAGTQWYKAFVLTVSILVLLLVFNWYSKLMKR